MSLIRADARYIPLVDGCVQTVVTSPPYFGLRDYGNAGQIGLEPSPDAYVQALLQVFAEVWRVLKDDGTVWLNIGDSYFNSSQDGRSDESSTAKPSGAHQALDSLASLSSGLGEGGPLVALGRAEDRQSLKRGRPQRLAATGIKSKDLVGIPWRVAFALRAEGWYLRSDIIWSKANPMPESVTDRPTKAHEYIFLLAKQERYYYNAEAVKEPLAKSTQEWDSGKDGKEGWAPSNPDHKTPQGTHGPSRRGHGRCGEKGDTRNKRSVWHVATQPYSGSHFATFPEALIEPCILAGSRPGDLVFDPFVGSGTVGVVSDRLMRRWVGTDLSYQDLSKKRTQQRGLKFAG